jgi:hypothetical protein
VIVNGVLIRQKVVTSISATCPVVLRGGIAA